MWSRSHPWVVAPIGLVLEAAATIPFALLDAPETSAALALLIAAAVAFLVGPRWGALVAARRLGALLRLRRRPRCSSARRPTCLARCGGPDGTRFRPPAPCPNASAAATRASWTQSRGDETQAIVGLDLEGNILTWDRGAERIYGHTEADVSDADVSLLGTEDDTAHILAALERVAKGERVDRSHLRQRGRNGEELLVSMALDPGSRRPRNRRRVRSHLRRDRARARGRAQVPRPRRGASTRHPDLGAERPQHRHVRQPAGRADARLLAHRLAGRSPALREASAPR